MRILTFAIFTFLALDLYANCRGCCSHHKGVTCSNGITQCRDGSPLSYKCESKGCNKCPAKQSDLEKQNVHLKKSYKRSYFSGWKDEDRDCLDTRHEILQARSKTQPTISKPKNSRCRVISGQWRDFYYDEVHTQSKDVEIDHLVSLKHAYDSGADRWSQSKRDRFAVDQENLVITKLTYNRQKGAKSILEWMPIDRAYACRYVDQWFHIKKKYGLKITAKEVEHKGMLKCEEVKRLPANY